MIGIIDLGFSNKTSLCNTLNSLEINYQTFNDASRCNEFSGVILPGVGNFHAASKELYSKNFVHELEQYFQSGRPLLGICLGMQLLFSVSYEGGLSKGLNLISGEVVKMEESKFQTNMHIGWNQIDFNSKKKIKIFENIDNEENFYFVHGYHIVQNDISLCHYTDVGESKVLAAVEKENFFGVQFHPEKSHKSGKKVLKNFVNLCA